MVQDTIDHVIVLLQWDHQGVTLAHSIQQEVFQHLRVVFPVTIEGGVLTDGLNA